MTSANEQVGTRTQGEAGVDHPRPRAPFEPPRGEVPPASSAPPTRGMTLGRLFGVQVHVDWSLLIIFALVTVSLGTGVFPAWHPDWTPLTTWGTALGAAVLFFASVLAHELSHALVARSQGVQVHRVTLFLFGGVAHMEEEPHTPKAELLIAIVGPVVSIAIGLLAWLAGSLLAAPSLPSTTTIEDPAGLLSQVGPIPTLLLWLGPVNVILGVFNMVPGFPLDGGRVLRAFLWWSTGDLTKASRWASRAGQVFAWTLMGLGVWSLLVGGLTQGLWLLLIGWFLNNAAQMSYERLLVRKALQGVLVRDLMFKRIERVPPDISVAELVERHFMASDQRAFPVESNGELLGLVCFDDLRRLPRERWAHTRAAELMTPLARLGTLSADAEAQHALDQLARRDVDQIPVMENARLVGLVRRRDIVKWLSLQAPHPDMASAHSRVA
jgi:Zn-dependent protease/predicted transcriptional regulator